MSILRDELLEAVAPFVLVFLSAEVGDVLVEDRGNTIVLSDSKNRWIAEIDRQSRQVIALGEWTPGPVTAHVHRGWCLRVGAEVVGHPRVRLLNRGSPLLL